MKITLASKFGKWRLILFLKVFRMQRKFMGYTTCNLLVMVIVKSVKLLWKRCQCGGVTYRRLNVLQSKF